MDIKKLCCNLCSNDGFWYLLESLGGTPAPVTAPQHSFDVKEARNVSNVGMPGYVSECTCCSSTFFANVCPSGCMFAIHMYEWMFRLFIQFPHSLPTRRRESLGCLLAEFKFPKCCQTTSIKLFCKMFADNLDFHTMRPILGRNIVQSDEMHFR